MKEYIQNIIFILDEAIENEDWELVSEAKNLLENEEFEDLQKILDKYEEELSIDQHGES